MSKLHYDNVSILNSTLYRNGPEELFKDCEDRVVFYRFTEGKEEWIPLPEKLIQRARSDTEKIQKTEPSKTFANNQIPEDKLEACNLYHETKDCGLYLTRQMQKEQEKLGSATKLETGLQPRTRKRKAKAETCEGLGLKCKAAKQSTSLKEKK